MSGTHIITNAEFSNCAVDLMYGNPYGTVSGHERLNNSNQKWRIVKFDGPDNFVLESDVARGFYASVYVHVDGAPLCGSPNPTIWALDWVPSSDAHRIKTKDGKYAWFLEANLDRLTIILRPADQVANDTRAQWKFERI